MAYFGGSSGMVGDPGFFDTLFGGVKRAVRGAVGFATGGPGGALRGITAPARRGIPSGFVPPPRVFRGRPQVGVIPATRDFFGLRPPTPGIPKIPKTVVVDVETGEMRPRRRRMNVGNAKALRRAIRRTDGFVRLSRSALKNTGFKIVSKSSGKVSRATMDKAVAAAHHAK